MNKEKRVFCIKNIKSLSDALMHCKKVTTTDLKNKNAHFVLTSVNIGALVTSDGKNPILQNTKKVIAKLYKKIKK